MTQIKLTLESEILHGRFTSNGKEKVFSELLECILNQVLNAQVAKQVEAERYERSDERSGYRNFLDKPPRNYNRKSVDT